MKRQKGQKTRTPGGRKRQRKTFGRLAFSCLAKNVPEGAVAANAELTEKMAAGRAEGGWFPDSNVAVPGPTFISVQARIQAEERAARKEVVGEEV